MDSMAHLRDITSDVNSGLPITLMAIASRNKIAHEQVDVDPTRDGIPHRIEQTGDRCHACQVRLAFGDLK